MKLHSGVKMADQFPKQAESDLTYLVDQKNSDRNYDKTLLLNSVIAKYCDLSVCLSDQLFDLLTTHKSQYFAQPRPIIVNYL